MEEVFWSRFARQLARGLASLRGFTHKYKNLEIVKVVLFATYEQDYAIEGSHGMRPCRASAQSILIVQLTWQCRHSSIALLPSVKEHAWHSTFHCNFCKIKIRLVTNNTLVTQTQRMAAAEFIATVPSLQRPQISTNTKTSKTSRTTRFKTKS